MRKHGAANLIPLDLEIERTCRKNRKNTRKAAMDPEIIEGVENRTLLDYVMPSVVGVQSAIWKPAIAGNYFEIKPGTIHMIQQSQFSGLASEDPNDHIANFVEVCDTFKFQNISDDAVKLRLFPFSLRDRAKSWLNSLPPDSITTWAELCQKFLSKFFPFEKTAKYRNDIVNFNQFDGETLYEAWARFKELLRKCPQHGLPRWMQIQTFFIGLTASTRTLVNAAAGGSLLQKTEIEAYTLLEELALNNDQCPVERQILKRQQNTPEMDAVKALTAQIATLTKQLQNNQAPVNSIHTLRGLCQWCQGPHASEECQQGNQMGNTSSEQANFVENFNRPNFQNANNYYTGTSNNHPNFSWKNPNNAMQMPQPPQQGQQFEERKPSLEDIVSKMGEHMNKFMVETRTTLQNQSAQIRSLETHMGQIANTLMGRPQGTLPSSTEVNPNEQCNAITLWSGVGIENSSPEKKKENEQQKETPASSTPLKRYEGQQTLKAPQQSSPVDLARVPFPQRLMYPKSNKQLDKFREIFKRLRINIPFSEALPQMLRHSKSMKEILSHKRKIDDCSIIPLTEECSAIIQQKLPQKLKDPGSFTIPCTIGGSTFERALCDLGASINLMPLSIFLKLGLGEAMPTRVRLQMADRSIKYPRGIIEDVLVKVDKFIFPVDFFVLDMEEDRNIPLILGRPFLATGGTLIDVQRGELKLRVQDEEVTFNVFNAMKYPKKSDIPVTHIPPGT